MGKKDNILDKTAALNVLRLLRKEYPDAKPSLNYRNNIQLLVATMLSAQCTDTRVNIVTDFLFKKYRTAADFSQADLEELEQEIKSVGFYSAKAKNIIEAAKIIESRFKGKVPGEMEELLLLPGVGRKTANIVLYNGFGKNKGVAVDTHVSRLSQRIGLSRNTEPDKIERDLMSLFPEKDWGPLNNILIFHGRKVCVAQKPRCGSCILRSLCLYPDKTG